MDISRINEGYTGCGSVVEMSWHRNGVLLLGAQSWPTCPGITAVGEVGSVLLSRLGWVKGLCHILYDGFHGRGMRRKDVFCRCTFCIMFVWCTPAFPRTGINTLAFGKRKMDTLDVHTGEIQYNLMEHIAQTQEWQQTADTQFANINNMMQSQHDDLQAYFCFQGFNPYQGP
uniref:Retrotransposon protein, putative, unclassified n=1 Tax=Oryza sativa subsp. japonica TaxID=39947 RepID=Q2QWS5_ORYSJ|nr:retrotransposon protein, putative, unclassified [Oryza sativa Japonica Group]